MNEKEDEQEVPWGDTAGESTNEDPDSIYRPIDEEEDGTG